MTRRRCPTERATVEPWLVSREGHGSARLRQEQGAAGAALREGRPPTPAGFPPPTVGGGVVSCKEQAGACAGGGRGARQAALTVLMMRVAYVCEQENVRARKVWRAMQRNVRTRMIRRRERMAGGVAALGTHLRHTSEVTHRPRARTGRRRPRPRRPRCARATMSANLPQKECAAPLYFKHYPATLSRRGPKS